MRNSALLLLALLLVTAAQKIDRCHLNQVRGCGQCPWSNTTRSPAGETAMLAYMPVLHPTSVVAVTFTDIIHLPGSYLLLLEMPGVASSEHVTVEVSSSSGSNVNILSIRGIADEPVEERVREFRGPSTKLFARKFVLPSGIDQDGIRFQLRDGLLRLTLPILPGHDSPSPSHDQRQVYEERGPPIPPDRARIPLGSCEIRDAHDLVLPEPLDGSGACRADESCVMSIMPLADVVWRGRDSYVVVWEMPGVSEASEVEVECWLGVEAEEPAFRRYVGRGEPGCMVSVAGSVEDDIGEQQWFDREGRVVRLERGGGRRKIFAGSLHFSPGDVTSRNMTYELSHGLLRVNLVRPVLPPLQETPGFSLWGRLFQMYEVLTLRTVSKSGDVKGFR